MHVAKYYVYIQSVGIYWQCTYFGEVVSIPNPTMTKSHPSATMATRGNTACMHKTIEEFYTNI